MIQKLRGGYSNVEKIYKRALIRRELGIDKDAKVLLSVGELNDNKNHETAIKAIKGMDVYYLIAGTGSKREHLQKLIDEQGMADRIKLIGFRTDIKDIYTAADVFVFPSFREGLSVALMEAMANGLPCAVSRIRGNVDLIKNAKCTFDPYDQSNVTGCIKKMLSVEDTLRQESVHNAVAIQNFSISVVLGQMKEIYGCEMHDSAR